MVLFCRQCGVSNFRTSKFRIPDIVQLILLRLPVRCLNCHERAFTFVPHFLKLRNARREQRRQRVGSV